MSRRYLIDIVRERDGTVRGKVICAGRVPAENFAGWHELVAILGDDALDQGQTIPLTRDRHTFRLVEKDQGFP